MQVVCPSVYPSVALRYDDYIGWITSKIISWLISQVTSLFADSNVTSLPQKEQYEILAGIVGVWTKWHWVCELPVRYIERALNCTHQNLYGIVRFPCDNRAFLFYHDVGLEVSWFCPQFSVVLC